LIPERKREYWLPLLRKAAGAENSQCQFDEDVTRNTSTGLLRTVIGMRTINPLTRNNWRASLVPAAAVIPAPRAYLKVVVVKKLVVYV